MSEKYTFVASAITAFFQHSVISCKKKTTTFFFWFTQSVKGKRFTGKGLTSILLPAFVTLRAYEDTWVLSSSSYKQDKLTVTGVFY